MCIRDRYKRTKHKKARHKKTEHKKTKHEKTKHKRSAPNMASLTDAQDSSHWRQTTSWHLGPSLSPATATPTEPHRLLTSSKPSHTTKRAVPSITDKGHSFLKEYTESNNWQQTHVWTEEYPGLPRQMMTHAPAADMPASERQFFDKSAPLSLPTNPPSDKQFEDTVKSAPADERYQQAAKVDAHFGSNYFAFPAHDKNKRKGKGRVEFIQSRIPPGPENDLKPNRQQRVDHDHLLKKKPDMYKNKQDLIPHRKRPHNGGSLAHNGGHSYKTFREFLHKWIGKVYETDKMRVDQKLDPEGSYHHPGGRPGQKHYKKIIPPKLEKRSHKGGYDDRVMNRKEERYRKHNEEWFKKTKLEDLIPGQNHKASNQHLDLIDPARAPAPPLDPLGSKASDKQFEALEKPAPTSKFSKFMRCMCFCHEKKKRVKQAQKSLHYTPKDGVDLELRKQQWRMHDSSFVVRPKAPGEKPRLKETLIQQLTSTSRPWPWPSPTLIEDGARHPYVDPDDEGKEEVRPTPPPQSPPTSKPPPPTRTRVRRGLIGHTSVEADNEGQEEVKTMPTPTSPPISTPKSAPPPSRTRVRRGRISHTYEDPDKEGQDEVKTMPTPTPLPPLPTRTRVRRGHNEKVSQTSADPGPLSPSPHASSASKCSH